MLRWIGSMLIVAALGTAAAVSQVKTDQPKPTAGRAVQAPVVTPAPPPMLRPLNQPRAKTTPAKGKPGCGTKVTRPEPKPSPTGPQPKFVCTQLESEAPAVWEGANMSFKFDIANHGAGDLHIRMKGG